METTAIILAAGFGKRMGNQLKQLLNINGVSMLEKVIQFILPCKFTEIITVIGHQYDQIQNAISIKDPRFRYLVNPDYAKGQGSSLLKGINSCQTQNIMIFLGDMPFIKTQTVEFILSQ